MVELYLSKLLDLNSKWEEHQLSHLRNVLLTSLPNHGWRNLARACAFGSYRQGVNLTSLYNLRSYLNWTHHSRELAVIHYCHVYSVQNSKLLESFPIKFKIPAAPPNTPRCPRNSNLRDCRTRQHRVSLA